MVKSRKTFIKSVVKGSVLNLLELAGKMYDKDPELSRRYTSLAWKMVRRYKIKLDAETRMKFCRKCLTVAIKDKTYKVRVDKKNKVREFICMNCGYRRKMAI